MNNQSKIIINIFSRYALVILLGLGNLFIIYKLLTIPTINSVSAILSIFSETLVIGNSVYFQDITIEIIPACVAGAAFYLLFILLFSTPNIKPLKRLEILIVSFAFLFAINIARIVLLVQLVDLESFETIHWIFWNIVSIVFVVGIWMAVVRIYHIKKIPFYSDFNSIKALIKKSKSSK